MEKYQIEWIVWMILNEIAARSIAANDAKMILLLGSSADNVIVKQIEFRLE